MMMDDNKEYSLGIIKLFCIRHVLVFISPICTKKTEKRFLINQRKETE